MQLKDIKDVVAKYTVTISKILDVSVVVVDKDLQRLANTYLYRHDPGPIRRNSIVGQVIETGKPMAVDSRSSCSVCQECPDINQCDIDGIIAVPIICRGEILGSFCLMVPRSRSALFRNLKSSVDFLENMSDLLSEKLLSAERYEDLNAVRRDRELIMDVIEDAIVSTDQSGAIDYCNDKFEAFFGHGDRYIGKSLADVVPHETIRRMLHSPYQTGSQLIYCENPVHGRNFYGFVYCYPKNLSNEHHSLLFVFRSINHINAELNEISNHRTSILFDHFWGQGREMQALLDRAKLLATTDETILIEGENGTGKESLAKAIHNFSDRSNEYFVTVDCGTTALESLDLELFGHDEQSQQTVGIGKVRLAHKGTLLLRNIDRLPLCFQERIAAFIKTKLTDNAPIDGPCVDVRLIFTSSEDIHRLVRGGYFCEDLYYRIVKNDLKIPAVRARKRTDIVTAIESAIRWSKCRNNRPDLAFDDEAMELLSSYPWPGNIQELELTIDRLVYACTTHVTAHDVECIGITRVAPAQVRSIEELEMEQIRRLLCEGHSKDDIAQMLGLGRATLYRKIKKYGLAR